jgi:hypothetical protein
MDTVIRNSGADATTGPLLLMVPGMSMLRSQGTTKLITSVSVMECLNWKGKNPSNLKSLLS